MAFDHRRLRLGELVAAGCAILLFIDMFLDWFGVDIDGVSESLGIDGIDTVPGAAGIDTGASAWTAFGFTDILMLLVILLALGLAFLSATQRTVALPVAASVVLTAVAAVVTLIVLYRLFNQPGPNEIVELRFGSFIGLVLLLGITLGGYMSMRDEGTSLADARAQAEQAFSSPGRDVPGERSVGTPVTETPGAAAPSGGSVPPPSSGPPAAGAAPGAPASPSAPVETPPTAQQPVVDPPPAAPSEPIGDPPPASEPRASDPPPPDPSR